ncbi:MAG: hypothetical protein F6K11_27250 [Leptolyngbya sp. SIO3F4]|nr:hypothetical protein [Leptolyngbya sp. SIO3F4]
MSTPARRGLGAYGADDRESWRKAVNQLNVSSRALDDLADARFTHIFPQLNRDDVLDQPLGQVWYALAQDSVEALTSGKTLEQVQFEEGAFSKRITGQLAPGQGRIFTLNLQEGQNLRINLQASENSTLMSLYLPAPSQKEPFLLSDSPETTWSGRLTQSGYYEIAIVSKSSNPINYALSVAVDNITNTVPKPEESTDSSEGTSGEGATDGGATETPVETPQNEAETPVDENAEETSQGEQGTTETPADAVEFN